MPEGTVEVEVLRRFPMGGVTYQVGHVLRVSARTADRMEAARPAYGRRVSSDPWAAFSDNARKTLENAGVEAGGYTGPRQEDGRVHISDVRDWLRAREAPDG